MGIFVGIEGLKKELNHKAPLNYQLAKVFMIWRGGVYTNGILCNVEHNTFVQYDFTTHIA